MTVEELLTHFHNIIDSSIDMKDRRKRITTFLQTNFPDSADWFRVHNLWLEYNRFGKVSKPLNMEL